MSNIVYGLTPAGFVAKPQSVIVQEMQSSLQAVFGQNINLGPESNFGQFVGIMSEREALIWQMGEAIYSSQYPGGAEGTSVDNILALSNLRRLPATPTRTDGTPLTQSDSIVLYGLLLFGIPGTVIPQGSIVQTSASPPLQFVTDAAVTIGAASNDVQNLFLSNNPTMGAYTLLFNGLITPSINYNALAGSTLLLFDSVPVTGSFTLSFVRAGITLTTGSIAYTATASQVQSAITTLVGYTGVTVSGDFMVGFTLVWGAIPNPITTFATNTLGVVATPVDSIQSAINSLFSSPNYPYTDVVVAGIGTSFTFTFGANSPITGQPSSANTAMPLMTVNSNTMMMSSTVTNIKVVKTTQGAPANVIASATCTVNGPNFVAAGSINSVGTSITGWSGVINQLDCLTGTNVEDDTEALVRRQNELQANANGPLQSIVEKVKLLANVSACIGFENLYDAALQLITFATLPVSGTFKLFFQGTLTGTLPFNASAGQIQTALNAISGFSPTLVTGSMTAGFTVDFNGSQGGQPQPLIQIVSNTTTVSTTVAFGRPGHSFEIVAEGGSDSDIGNQIYSSKPAGIQTYGSVQVVIFDENNVAHPINFSRPTAVPIYIVVSMVTDLTDNNPKFNPNSVNTIQLDLVAIGKMVSIGGLVIGFGTDGLIGAFNNVLGIKQYTLFFDRVANPTTNTNIQMQPEEVPVFEQFNITVSYV